MKRCPKCNQEFSEEWLTFCTTDGTPLTEAPPSRDYPPPTMTMPRPPVTANQEERPTMKMPSEGVYGGPLAMPQQQQPVAPGWQPPPAPFAMAPQPQQGLAIASLVLGLVSIILGWCCSFGLLTAPVAVGLGIFALVQIKNNPTQYTGKPLAIIGIVTGSLYVAVNVLLILLYGLGMILGGLGNLG
jgi:hypothetical protein